MGQGLREKVEREWPIVFDYCTREIDLFLSHNSLSLLSLSSFLSLSLSVLQVVINEAYAGRKEGQR